MPLQATSGAASYDAFGGGAAALPSYIEDVFSTWLYAGTGAIQTITNGIDLAGEGGLVWIKQRNSAVNHRLFDTNRGSQRALETNTTSGGLFSAGFLRVFNSDGFEMGSGPTVNESGDTYASWTFRKQPKFFDVVTWTGDGANRTIAHNLGSVPGCIIVKRIDTTANWQVYHRSLANTEYIMLNSIAAKATGATRWNSTTPTDTVFSLGTDTTVNASGGTYVAYLFAHDAGGFGLTGTDNVISCGSFYAVQSGSDVSVDLGYEPQFVLMKNIDSTDDWRMYDVMRGMQVNPGNAMLRPNSSAAEVSNTSAQCYATATGFVWAASTGLGYTGNVIYIAIRRGPMKVPTTGTSVFGLNARTGTGANATVTGSAGVSDAVLIKNRGSAVGDLFASRLTRTGYMETSSSEAEVAAGTAILQANPWDVMDGVKVGASSTITNASANTYINYLFDRAPGFFDVVCYTGTGVARTVAHNLAAVPELMIVKKRNGFIGWIVYSEATGATKYLYLNTTQATGTFSGTWNNTAPTISSFTVGTDTDTNQSGSTFVAYLFATCPGVSKVGSFTGTGATQVINCGFTGGARFVLIKATNTTSDWYVWDSARGIVAGNDPRFILNNTAAEVTSTDWVDTAATGFELSNAGGNLANSSGVSYIFLAIA
jgi:hypothetical protein